MSDLIDRQVALDTFGPWLNVEGYSEGELNMLRAVLYELKTLPTAQPELTDEDMKLIKQLRSYLTTAPIVVREWTEVSRMEKTCDNCVFCDVSATEEPCRSCDGPDCRFTPKEEDMGEKTFTMTFTTAKIDDDALKTITGETELDYKEELEVARRKIQEKDEIIKGLERVLASKDGMIEGLKFAIRCDGVSGADVR